MSAGVAVVHLVRAGNGPEPFRAFLESYRRHDAGLEHELVLLFKGFSSEADAASYVELAGPRAPRALLVPDRGFDLGAYRAAAERLEHDRLCFLNSFSEVLAAGWLASLDRALAPAQVGLVGATGSWGSIRSYARFSLGLGGPYARAMLDRRRATALLAAVNERRAEAQGASAPKRIPGITYARALAEQAWGFTPFPSPHVRTNGFMIDAELMRRLRVGRLRGKGDAYRLESGRHSITSQVQALGLEALLVARDGRSFAPAQWRQSATFWQDDQQALLVADNQTRAYEMADEESRRMLRAYAWGDRRPAVA